MQLVPTVMRHAVGDISTDIRRRAVPLRYCIYSRENTHNIAQAFKNNRGRLPERNEYLSLLAAFTTK